jgi:hypothetical protein
MAIFNGKQVTLRPFDELRASGIHSVHPEREAVEGRESGIHSVHPEREAVEGRASSKSLLKSLRII